MSKRDWFGAVVVIAFMLLGGIVTAPIVLVLGENSLGAIAAVLVGGIICGVGIEIERYLRRSN
jgi:hypothetical protein